MSQVNFSAADIKELREKTGAGMMDCKKALTENAGSLEQATDWLRKKGLAAAQKKSGRVAAEGLVVIACNDNSSEAAVIELNSETDFVAKNDKFQALAQKIANVSLKTPADVEVLKAVKLENGKTVAEDIIEHVSVIGENLQLRRCAKISGDVVISYVHNAVLPTAGKIGVLVAFSSQGDKQVIQKLGKQIAMHIAASRPESLNIESLDQNLVNKEKEILTEQAKASGKPDEVIAKMIEGRIRKYYAEVVLLEQLFVIDGKTQIKQVIEAASKEAGSPITLTSYVRFQLGEGIEKKEENFAAEVAAVANNS